MLLSASPELDVLLPLQAYVQPGPSSVSSCSFLFVFFLYSLLDSLAVKVSPVLVLFRG